MTNNSKEQSGPRVSKGLTSEFPQLRGIADAVLSLVPAMKIAWGHEDEDVIAVENACIELKKS